MVGIEEVLHKMKEVFASLYNDRAISYRVHKGFAHADVALSAGVQRMVRSDLGAAGVMFTIDTESGFEDVVFITSSYGPVSYTHLDVYKRQVPRLASWRCRWPWHLPSPADSSQRRACGPPSLPGSSFRHWAVRRCK